MPCYALARIFNFVNTENTDKGRYIYLEMDLKTYLLLQYSIPIKYLEARREHNTNLKRKKRETFESLIYDDHLFSYRLGYFQNRYNTHRPNSKTL